MCNSNLFLQSTRSPNLFEISPRPFTVTTSPIQTRGQFSSFGFEANPYKFAPAAQQQQPLKVNPFQDAGGYDEVSYAHYFLKKYNLRNYIASP